ncbi:MAG: cytochrome P450 [Chitinophagaceae bacterium]
MNTEITGSVHKTQSLPGTISINELPGPAGLPLLGNVLQLPTEKLHRVFAKWSDQYGPIYKIKLGIIPIVVITAPESVQHVLKNRPDKFRRLGKMDFIIREVGISGVFNAEGEEWKQQRKVVTQALNLQHIKSFFPLLVTITEKFLARWNRLSSENSLLEVKSELTRYTVDNTSLLAFGYNMNTIEKDKDIIQEHLKNIFPAIFNRISLPVPYWRYLKLPADKKLEKSLAFINKFMQGIVDKTREEMAQNPELDMQPTNFLQAVIAASDPENPVSNEEIIGNVLTMLLAGEDTTAHTIAWVLYFMHLYPEVQQKMQQEADRILGNENTLKEYDDIAKLTYIEAVTFESMRFKPVAPVLYFDTLEDVAIEGVQLPKGTAVFLQTNYEVTKETNFSNADKFMPERWMAGGCPVFKVHDERAFIPFGAGPRFCPGYHLAMVEIKTVLSMICKHFTVVMQTRPEDVKEILAFTMMPSEFVIRLERRK